MSVNGIISGIKRMEIHDGDGIRTTVFFKGCSLECIWCHNPESIGFRPQIAWLYQKCLRCGTCAAACPHGMFGPGLIDRVECNAENGCRLCVDACPVKALISYGQSVTSDEVVRQALLDRRFYEESGGGVTLSGGECLMQPDFAIDIAKKLKAQGISVYIDTCGLVPRATLEKILPYTDRFLYDIKAVDPALHERLTGSRNERIIDNLRYLSDAGASVEIRYPYVVGFNDGEAQAIGSLLEGMRGIVKVKVLAYHNLARSRYESLDMPDTMPPDSAVPTSAQVDCAVGILKAHGLNAVNGMKDD